MKPNYEVQIMQLLKIRGEGKTICPSELLEADDKQNTDRMEEVRDAARRLVKKGKIVITQKGAIVDPNNTKGPIRLRLV